MHEDKKYNRGDALYVAHDLNEVRVAQEMLALFKYILVKLIHEELESIS